MRRERGGVGGRERGKRRNGRAGLTDHELSLRVEHPPFVLQAVVQEGVVQKTASSLLSQLAEVLAERVCRSCHVSPCMHSFIHSIRLHSTIPDTKEAAEQKRRIWHEEEEDEDAAIRGNHSQVGMNCTNPAPPQHTHAREKKGAETSERRVVEGREEQHAPASVREAG